MNVKSYLILGLIALFLISLAAAAYLGDELIKSRQETGVAISNMKAYQAYGDSIKNQERVLLLTVEQLKNSYDSVDRELYTTAKELKIKDKEVLRLAKIIGIIGKKDTIEVRDTIFKKDFKLDTTLNYKPFYTLDLTLQYPNRVVVNPSFYLDLSVITSLQKETIDPPHKFFFVRWFQKKQNVITVDIVKKNPYVTLEKSRFIDIKK